MKKLTTMLAVLAVAGVASATPTSFSEDFSGFTAGQSIAGATWNQKWVAGSQQNLMTKDSAGGGHAVLSGLAESQYRNVFQTGFTIGAGETATIQSQFRYVHDGVGGWITNGPVQAVNENTFGLLVTTQPQWWNGSNQEATLANRGAAMGNRIPIAPWIENWQGHGTFGVNNSSVATSVWFDVIWTLTENAGAIDAQFTVTDGGAIGFTSSLVTLPGITTADTLYAGYNTGFNNTGTNLASFAKIDEVHMDNFQVDVIPEPATLGLIGVAGTLLLVRRRFTS